MFPILSPGCGGRSCLVTCSERPFVKVLDKSESILPISISSWTQFQILLPTNCLDGTDFVLPLENFLWDRTIPPYHNLPENMIFLAMKICNIKMI